MALNSGMPLLNPCSSISLREAGPHTQITHTGEQLQSQSLQQNTQGALEPSMTTIPLTLTPMSFQLVLKSIPTPTQLP